MSLRTTAQALSSVFATPNHTQPLALRPRPERLVLGVRTGLTPSPKPPVRLFVGTEPAQYRAERVFVWSIEQVRDPSRVYEIYLMKNLVGFDRRGWLTGFTNYRFAIPHFAESLGLDRAIYNDVDQVYLADPAELFDTDLGEHGFLSISERDTSVMLIDCHRMAGVWRLADAQHTQRKALEAKARSLWGACEAGWNARDEEYDPGDSKVLHFTTIHAQPWQPFPERYAYQPNPVAHVWFALERSATEAGYHHFSAQQPSKQYAALLGSLQAKGRGSVSGPAGAGLSQSLGVEAPAVQKLAAQVGAQTLLEYRLLPRHSDEETVGRQNTGSLIRTIVHRAVATTPLSARAAEQFDGVVATGLLDYIPDEDVLWVLRALFQQARRVVFVSVNDAAQTQTSRNGASLRRYSRPEAWWLEQFEMVSACYPQLHWQFAIQNQSGHTSLSHAGGCRLNGPPTVWVLTSNKPGHTTQALGLAEALGWPYEVKELHFTQTANRHKKLFGTRSSTCIGLDTDRSAPLASPWPDVIITAGWRPARVARWIRDQTKGRTRLVLLGRKGGQLTQPSDIVVSCRHFRLAPHPRRIETLAPLTLVRPERLAQAAEEWRDILDSAPHPRIAVLVGGASARFCFDAQTAKRLGEQVQALAQQAGGSVFVTTSRRTGSQAITALQQALGPVHHFHEWQPGQQANPYLAYLTLADVLIVTGESESMLAEAAATDKPLYIYPLAERDPNFLNLAVRLKEWLVHRAQHPRRNTRGTIRPQRGLAYQCARLVERGTVQPRRDLHALHQALVQHGYAHFFGEPLELEPRPTLQEFDSVAQQVRRLLRISVIR